jgi:AraC-like DNA-binding protein
VRQGDGGPVLAKRAGQYREAAPVPALADHVLCRWTHTAPPEPAGPVVVVPDGCVDLIWAGDRLVVAGPDVTAARPLLQPGATLIGLRFRPGAAQRWLGLPMSEIVGRQVELQDLRRPWARDLAARIGEADTVAERTGRLEAGLAQAAPDIDRPAAEMDLVFQLLGRGAAEPDSSLAVVLDRLGTNERSLRRRCHAAFGYGPKTLDRILRFQRFLGLAEGGEAAGLAALAAVSGYADQAHLTREVRRLSGLTPAVILGQLTGGRAIAA